MPSVVAGRIVYNPASAVHAHTYTSPVPEGISFIADMIQVLAHPSKGALGKHAWLFTTLVRPTAQGAGDTSQSLGARLGGGGSGGGGVDTHITGAGFKWAQ